jgi:hypothetical protein
MTGEFRKLSNDDLIPELVQIWDLRFKLAIAQQLSVISAHLGKIVSNAEEKK